MLMHFTFLITQFRDFYVIEMSSDLSSDAICRESMPIFFLGLLYHARMPSQEDEEKKKEDRPFHGIKSERFHLRTCTIHFANDFPFIEKWLRETVRIHLALDVGLSAKYHDKCASIRFPLHVITMLIRFSFARTFCIAPSNSFRHSVNHLEVHIPMRL